MRRHMVEVALLDHRSTRTEPTIPRHPTMPTCCLDMRGSLPRAQCACEKETQRLCAECYSGRCRCDTTALKERCKISVSSRHGEQHGILLHAARICAFITTSGTSRSENAICRQARNAQSRHNASTQATARQAPLPRQNLREFANLAKLGWSGARAAKLDDSHRGSRQGARRTRAMRGVEHPPTEQRSHARSPDQS
jgi:hypothetical protein